MKLAKLSILSAFLFLPLLMTAQEKDETPQPMSLQKTKSWTDLTSKSGVKVQYKYIECHHKKDGIHKENVLLRLENTNGSKVELEWDQLLWYDGSCKTCGKGQEYHHKVSLESGEVEKGTCALDAPSHLQVFASYLKSGNGLPDSELTGIKLHKLQVE